MMRLDYYVRAFYDLNLPDNVVKAYREILSLEKLLEEYPLLKDISISNKSVINILKETLNDYYSEIFINFLLVLIEDRYLSNFERVSKLYLSYLIKDNLYFVVDIKSAQALSKQVKEKINLLIKENYGNDLELNYQVIPELVMGLVISINHQVIDLSALGQLKHLASEVLQ